jgi:hypothetical protein
MFSKLQICSFNFSYMMENEVVKEFVFNWESNNHTVIYCNKRYERNKWGIVMGNNEVYTLNR